MEQGYIQVYTGNGKGKTTAALGQCLRAVGRGLKVIVYQFLKGSLSGELESAKALAPNFKIKRFGGMTKLFWQLRTEEKEELKAMTKEGYGEILKAVRDGSYDVIVLDEIMAALEYELLSQEDVLRLMEEKAPRVELILTGRNAPEAVLDKADLITEMRAVRHYYAKGIAAREGIEK